MKIGGHYLLFVRCLGLGSYPGMNSYLCDNHRYSVGVPPPAAQKRHLLNSTLGHFGHLVMSRESEPFESSDFNQEVFMPRIELSFIDFLQVCED